MSLGTLALVVMFNAPANAAPAVVTPVMSAPVPAPRARASSLPMPAPRAKRRGERSWLPTTYALSRNAGFTPWTSFLSLGDDAVGRWTIEGTSVAGGTHCSDIRHSSCESFAQALLAAVWQPFGGPVGLYAGLHATSVGASDGMNVAVGPSAGIRITTASLATLVKRRRGR